MQATLIEAKLPYLMTFSMHLDLVASIFKNENSTPLLLLFCHSIPNTITHNGMHVQETLKDSRGILVNSHISSFVSTSRKL